MPNSQLIHVGKGYPEKANDTGTMKYDNSIFHDDIMSWTRFPH